jgi:hypothetical protein
MLTIEKIQPTLFDNLYEAFLSDDDPLSNEQDWRNVFDYQFDNKQGHCGYAMLEDGKVVGMLGMVFSERHIQGELKKFCNLHTWWVREDFRGRSLLLFRPVLRLDDYNVTHFTPCDRVRAISRRLGFKDLSSQLKILLPSGAGSFERSDESVLIYDQQIIETDLGDCDRKIFLDHRPYDVGHLMIRQGGDCCYLLYTHVVRHRLSYCHIHYISKPRIFLEKERLIRSSLVKRHRARFVAIDARLVHDVKIPFSFDFWAPANALYRPRNIEAEHVDNLYSDVVFLKLSTLPNLSHEFAQILRRCTDFRLWGSTTPGLSS